MEPNGCGVTWRPEEQDRLNNKTDGLAGLSVLDDTALFIQRNELPLIGTTVASSSYGVANRRDSPDNPGNRQPPDGAQFTPPERSPRPDADSYDSGHGSSGGYANV